MNFSLSLLSWWQWGLLLAIPPAIVLLYFLKLRREPLEVPSTYLWHRTIEDLHVNSIWQRLRQNLLLLLQLLLILLAILACLNPNWRGSRLQDDRFIFLIDNSASMNATDVAPSRLENAKQQVGTLIDAMKSGDVAMIVAFSDQARTVQSFTDNHRLLKRKLDGIEPTHRKSDLEQALRFAAGLANPGRSAYGEGDAAAADALPASLYIFSDGRVISQPEFSMGNLKPTYVPVGKEDAANVGIVAFQASRNPEKPDRLQAFANLRNFNSQPAELELSLYLDGKMIDAASIELAADAQGGAEFSLSNVDSGVLRLDIDTPDSLPVDNQAYTVLDITQRANLLLVTLGNSFLEYALTTERIKKFAEVKIAAPDFLKGDEYKKDAEQGNYDLVIFDQCVPETPLLMPQSNTVFFNALPAGDVWAADEVQSQPYIIDIDRSHPLMQFVEMTNTLIAECRPLRPPKGASTLVDSDLGPLIAVVARDSFEDVVIGFGLIARDTDGSEFFNTLWPREPSFPVFMQNTLSYLGGVSEQSNAAIFQPGQLIRLRLDTPSKNVALTTPSGTQVDMVRGRSGVFSYGGSDQIGIYEIRDPATPQTTHKVAVNLFDELESNIRPVPELRTQFETIQGTRGIERTRREAWKLLLLVALVVLLIEWYVYNRRVYL